MGADERNAFQPFLFYDIGAVWHIDNARTGPGNAASAGGGVRFSLGEVLSGAFEVAKPLTLTPAQEDDRSPRVFFQLSVRY